MKSKLLVSTVLVGTALMALAATDPVLMTINGKDVKLSEFEYLYNKNNQQQEEKDDLRYLGNDRIFDPGQSFKIEGRIGQKQQKNHHGDHEGQPAGAALPSGRPWKLGAKKGKKPSFLQKMKASCSRFDVDFSRRIGYNTVRPKQEVLTMSEEFGSDFITIDIDVKNLFKTTRKINID